jgi:hypothetical protein
LCSVRNAVLRAESSFHDRRTCGVRGNARTRHGSAAQVRYSTGHGLRVGTEAGELAVARAILDELVELLDTRCFRCPSAMPTLPAITTDRAVTTTRSRYMSVQSNSAGTRLRTHDPMSPSSTFARDARRRLRPYR